MPDDRNSIFEKIYTVITVAINEINKLPALTPTPREGFQKKVGSEQGESMEQKNQDVNDIKRALTEIISKLDRLLK